jgi:hypothetical protein
VIEQPDIVRQHADLELIDDGRLRRRGSCQHGEEDDGDGRPTGPAPTFPNPLIQNKQFFFMLFNLTTIANALVPRGLQGVLRRSQYLAGLELVDRGSSVSRVWAQGSFF